MEHRHGTYEEGREDSLVGRPLEVADGHGASCGKVRIGETVVYDREGNTRRRFSSVRYSYASNVCVTHH
jgi:hypothetical protein